MSPFSRHFSCRFDAFSHPFLRNFLLHFWRGCLYSSQG
jgi:hypothetical protein